ncbi:MAG: STAS domain-containing protein [Candidatus Eremiobacteraeota bacterium]|nr:STAS domain-containing protein [Candidatus Eremiobacteraeota bacterium]
MVFVERHGNTVVITPRCDLDIASREMFSAAIVSAAKASAGPIVVSLLHCQYVDSTALYAIAKAHRSLGSRISLVIAPGAHIARIFEIAGFDKFIAMHPSLDAVAAFTAS